MRCIPNALTDFLKIPECVFSYLLNVDNLGTVGYAIYPSVLLRVKLTSA